MKESLIFKTFVALLTVCQSIQARTDEIPDLIPTDQVQRLNSYLPRNDSPTAELLAINWNIKFRTYYEYSSIYNDQPFLSLKIVDDGSGWSQYQKDNITERHITNFIPDANGNIASEYYSFSDGAIYTPLGHADFYRNEMGLVILEDHFDANDELRFSLETQYDNEGRIVRKSDATGVIWNYTVEGNSTEITTEGSNVRVKRYFNDDGQLIREYFTNEDGSQEDYHFTYDVAGNLVQSIHPDNRETLSTYDDHERLLTRRFPDGSEEIRSYDTYGRLFNFLDRHNVEHSYVYDEFGRAIQEIAVDATGEVIDEKERTFIGFRCRNTTYLDGTEAHYRYDFAGRKTEQTHGSQTKSFNYDALGRVASVIISDENGTKTSYHEYDLSDRLIQLHTIDANGNELNRNSFSYPLVAERMQEGWVYEKYAGDDSEEEIGEEEAEEEENEEYESVPPELQWMLDAIFEGVNQYRLEKGHPPLKLDPFLSSLSQKHCNNMAAGIVPPGHDGLMERAQACRDHFGGTANFGENVALNAGLANPPEVAVQGWINSSGHERQMVGSFELTGIGVTVSGGMYFFTQIFVMKKH